ncbi:MAG: hypothetical protein JW904_12240 [Spirochaetales bacterium]|nr:hypothetical protein [Spirochaetales bacterium]
MKKHIITGIKQADGSIIRLPETGDQKSFSIALTPAHLRQRKIKLVFLSLSGPGKNHHTIDRVSIRINKNTIQDNGTVKLHCRYVNNTICLSVYDAQGEQLPVAMFSNKGISRAGIVFKIAAGIVYAAAIAALMIFLAEKTIPGVDVLKTLGFRLPF